MAAPHGQSTCTRSSDTDQGQAVSTSAHLSDPVSQLSISGCAFTMHVRTVCQRIRRRARSARSEKHTMLDFTLGKDVGIGTFGVSTSTQRRRLRVAQFALAARNQTVQFRSALDFVPDVFREISQYLRRATAGTRSFHGIGPEIAWDASGRFWAMRRWPGHTRLGRECSRSLRPPESDIAASGRMTATSVVMAHCELRDDSPSYMQTRNVHRSRTVTVPNLGGYAGLSVHYQRRQDQLRLSRRRILRRHGWRAGDVAKKENRGFYGPYLNHQPSASAASKTLMRSN